MERQPYPPSGSCVAKNSLSQHPWGGVPPPCGVKETLVVNGGIWCANTSVSHLWVGCVVVVFTRQRQTVFAVGCGRVILHYSTD